MKKLIVILSLLLILSTSYIVYTKLGNLTISDNQIRDKLESLSQLTTGEYNYKEIIYTKESEDIFWIPIKNKELLFSIEYKITTGLNLSLGYEIKKNIDYIEIVLPPVQVLSIDAQDTTIEEYFVKERFSSIKREDYFSIINQTKDEMLEGELIRRILEESEERAITLIKTLFSVSGYQVRVRFSSTIGLNR